MQEKTKSFSSFFRTLDIFGLEPKYKSRNTYYYRTLIGLVLSIITILTVIGLSLKDVFNFLDTTQPISINQQIIPQEHVYEENFSPFVMPIIWFKWRELASSIETDADKEFLTKVAKLDIKYKHWIRGVPDSYEQEFEIVECNDEYKSMWKAHPMYDPSNKIFCFAPKGGKVVKPHPESNKKDRN